MGELIGAVRPVDLVLPGSVSSRLPFVGIQDGPAMMRSPISTAATWLAGGMDRACRKIEATDCMRTNGHVRVAKGSLHVPSTYMQSTLVVLVLSVSLSGCLGVRTCQNSTCASCNYEQTSYQEPALLNGSPHESIELDSHADPEAVIEVLPTLHESSWTFPNLKANTISAVKTAERNIKNLFE